MGLQDCKLSANWGWMGAYAFASQDWRRQVVATGPLMLVPQDEVAYLVSSSLTQFQILLCGCSKWVLLCCTAGSSLPLPTVKITPLGNPWQKKKGTSFQFLSFKVSMMLPLEPHFILCSKAYGKDSPIHFPCQDHSLSCRSHFLH